MESEGPAHQDARAFIASLDEVDLSRFRVVGAYTRFEEAVRNALQDVRQKILAGFEPPGRKRENHLIWAAPGTGKTYFVQQVATSLPDGVRYYELNLAKCTEAEFRTALGRLDGSEACLCLVDEIDAKPQEPWPYEVLLPYLDAAVERGARFVFVLAGSSGSSLEEIKQRIAARPKGTDLLSRIPSGHEYVIGPMSLGDRLLIVLSQLQQAGQEMAREIRAIEKLGLYYVALNTRLANARQLREFAARAVERVPKSDDRVKYDHLFMPGDPENKVFWVQASSVAEGLVNSFVTLAGDRVRFSPAGVSVSGPSPGRAADSIPAVAVDARPCTNLPRQLTSFIGREREIEEVKRLLPTTALLTLSGPGGCGKTRLGFRVAADLVSEYPDGVWVAELAALSAPTLVPLTVASALGVREQPGRPVLATLAEYLQPKQSLLLLDNCEHLLSACAHLAEALLRVCPHLRILATSREGLGIGGELTYRVPPLSVPDIYRLPPLDTLVKNEAFRLFVERATFALPSFKVTDQNARAVAHICDRLDGIPLAIELAAVHVRALRVDGIAARLNDRFRLLRGGSRTALARHQTLQGMMDWSYDLLAEKERALLRRLSVFAGGFTLEAAEAIGSGNGLDEGEVLIALTHLVDKSLVLMGAQGNDDRYRLLETVRQYARNRLQELGEVAQTRGKHASFFLALAEEAEPHLAAADQETWVNHLEIEHDNLRTALEWSKTNVGGEETGLRLAGALWRFWNVRGYWSEGLRRLEEAVASGSGTSPSARAKAFFGAGVLAFLLSDNVRAAALLDQSLALSRQMTDKRGIADSLRILAQVAWQTEDRDRARVLGEESLALFQELQDTKGVAAAFRFLGFLALSRHDLERGRSSLEQSLALARELGDKKGIAQSLYALGQIAREHGDHEQATKLYEESLVLSRDIGDKYFISNSLNTLGILAKYRSDYVQARALQEESLAIRKELGDKGSIAQSLCSLASVALAGKDCRRAIMLYRESLSLRKETSHRSSIAECFEGLGQVAEAQGESEHAARLLATAARLREGLPSPAPMERREIEQSVAKVQAALGEAIFQVKWAEGQAMTLDQAIEYALARETPDR